MNTPSLNFPGRTTKDTVSSGDLLLTNPSETQRLKTAAIYYLSGVYRLTGQTVVFTVVVRRSGTGAETSNASFTCLALGWGWLESWGVFLGARP